MVWEDEMHELQDDLEDKLRPLLELPDNLWIMPPHVQGYQDYRRLHARAKASLITIFTKRLSYPVDASGSHNLADFFEDSERHRANIFQKLDLDDLGSMDIFTDLMSSIFKNTVDYEREILSDRSRYFDAKQLFMSLRQNVRERLRFCPVDNHEQECFYAGCIAFVIGYILELQNNLVNATLPREHYEERSYIRVYAIIGSLVIFCLLLQIIILFIIFDYDWPFDFDYDF